MSQLRSIKIRSALISVYSKEGLAPLVQEMHRLGIDIISTGGTQSFIESLNIPVTPVEKYTQYPSILDGRVKTLHPQIFGGILARREREHLVQLETYDIPEIDMVIVDLYPFEKTVASTDDDEAIIEKIDIGGISLIRAAAKNFRDVVVIPSVEQYSDAMKIMQQQEGVTTYGERHSLARKAFAVSSHYDTAIYKYFNKTAHEPSFHQAIDIADELRYGENPHQKAYFFGKMNDVIEKLHGKELSYNNLVDVDSAINLIQDFRLSQPTIAILKHTNPCGVATREKLIDAWNAALAGDPISAFGGVIISNVAVDVETAENINTMFYEVLIAPDFSNKAIEVLTEKKNRILLKLKDTPLPQKSFKSILNGVLEQDADNHVHLSKAWTLATTRQPEASELIDMEFANKCVKHLKSNAIVLVKNQMMLGMGCGQTSRVEALNQAIQKAKHFGFSLTGAVMGSDAFFPFPDCVEIAHKQGISAVVQPGGSVKDQDSTDYCNNNGMTMMITGYRHFKH